MARAGEVAAKRARKRRDANHGGGGGTSEEEGIAAVDMHEVIVPAVLLGGDRHRGWKRPRLPDDGSVPMEY